MPSQKLLPGRFLLPLWCWFNSVIPQNIGNRTSRDLISQIRKCAEYTPVTPVSILLRQTNDEGLNLSGRGRSPWSTVPAPVVLLRDQSAVPRHQRVGCYKASDFLQDSATEFLGFGGKPTALIVVQPDSPSTELLS